MPVSSWRMSSHWECILFQQVKVPQQMCGQSKLGLRRRPYSWTKRRPQTKQMGERSRYVTLAPQNVLRFLYSGCSWVSADGRFCCEATAQDFFATAVLLSLHWGLCPGCAPPGCAAPRGAATCSATFGKISCSAVVLSFLLLHWVSSSSKSSFSIRASISLDNESCSSSVVTGVSSHIRVATSSSGSSEWFFNISRTICQTKEKPSAKVTQYLHQGGINIETSVAMTGQTLGPKMCWWTCKKTFTFRLLTLATLFCFEILINSL